jgi:hypothetical protein
VWHITRERVTVICCGNREWEVERTKNIFPKAFQATIFATSHDYFENWITVTCLVTSKCEVEGSPTGRAVQSPLADHPRLQTSSAGSWVFMPPAGRFLED